MADVELTDLLARVAAGRQHPYAQERRWRVPCAAIASVALVWMVVPALGLVRASILPSPLEVVRVTRDLFTTGELGQQALVSFQELALGLVPASLVGIALGSGLGRSRRLAQLLDPPLMVLNATPRIALLPLLVIWFGIGPASKAWIAFLGAVLPVVINTQAGVRSVDPAWIRAVQSLGGSRWQVTRMVLLPGALPAILTGVRLGIGRAILGVLASEMYASTGGIGHLLQDYGNAGRTPQVVALGLAAALLGAACVGALALAEAHLANWRSQA